MADEDDGPGPIPIGPGVFDTALYKLKEQGSLPKLVRDHLHFVETAGGRTCLEVVDIQKLATEGKMLSVSNPSYIRGEVKGSKNTARYFLAKLGISEDEARSFGQAFRQALDSAERELEGAAV